jgi:hypothetical protein
VLEWHALTVIPAGRRAQNDQQGVTPLDPTQTRLRGWAYRIRTAESGHGLPDWICVTTWPEVGASPVAETFALELNHTQSRLGPYFGGASGARRGQDREHRFGSGEGNEPRNSHGRVRMRSVPPSESHRATKPDGAARRREQASFGSEPGGAGRRSSALSHFSRLAVATFLGPPYPPFVD